MPRGQPDYGQYAPTEQYATLSDLAELARRLTELIYSEGRGATVYHDDFEGTVLKWTGGIGIGGTVTFDQVYPQSGSQCIKLYPSGVSSAFAAISKEYGVVASQRLGSEISFCNPSSELSFYNEIAYWDGADFYRGAVKIDFSTNKLYLRTGTGGWTEFTDITPFYTSGYSYYHFKIVVDFGTKKYVRMMLNGVEYDLSAYDLAVMTGAGAVRLQQGFYATNETGVAASLLIDDSIFTQEEP